MKKNKDYYYRLIQEDHDGTRTSSEIVTARLNRFRNDQSLLKLYPNPTQDLVSLEWAEDASEIALERIQLLNVFGARVAPVRVSQNTFDLSHLPSGIYFLRG